MQSQALLHSNSNFQEEVQSQAVLLEAKDSSENLQMRKLQSQIQKQLSEMDLKLESLKQQQPENVNKKVLAAQRKEKKRRKVERRIKDDDDKEQPSQSKTTEVDQQLSR